MKNKFHNADEAYEALLDEVVINGIDFDNTKAIFNCGFYILNPEDNHIKNKQRNWSLEYAEAEWQWSLCFIFHIVPWFNNFICLEMQLI